MCSKGKMNITIPRTNYSPGDTITGSVVLTLKKPVKARELCISLIGEQRVTRTRRRGRSGNRRVSTTTQRTRIYDFKQQLDTEKEYTRGGEYDFEIKIPADLLNTQSQEQVPGGTLGQGLKIARTAASMAGVLPRSHIKWYLSAKLDIPRWFDVNKKADITISV